MIDCWIGLGANVGEPLTQLVAAASAMATLPQSHLIATSGVYRSKPMGPQDQPDYLNACAHLKTDLSANALLKALKDIEANMGRVTTRRWGERVIDLDILLFGEQCIAEDNLTVPHKGLEQRAFVIGPLIDITPEHFTLPNGTLLASLWQQCDQQSLQRLQARLL